MKKLHISPDLLLTPDVQTSTVVIYGGKGMGKTNLGAVLVEELSKAELRWSVLDPLGVWWGLRHSSDGKGPGIECLVLGGPHGDIPIEPTGGAVVADLVVDETVNVLIDFSRKASGEMWSKGEKIRFVTDYAKRLFQRQGELVGGHRREPIFQLLDEAARYIPQVIPSGAKDIAECVGAWEDLVEEGRNVGIGVGLITQRSARMNKSVSEVADAIFSFRIVGPNSLAAIMDWLGEHVPKEQIKSMIETVRSLDRGRCLVVSPGWLKFEGVVGIRLRETFDSSATPKAGERAKRVTGNAAKPDLAQYAERMKATIERVKENDPRELKAQLARLKTELAKAQTAKPAAAAKAPKIDQADLRAQLDRAIARAMKERDQMWQRAVLHYRHDLDKAIGESLKLLNGTINTVGFVHPENLNVDVKIERPLAKDSTPAVSSPDAVSGTRGRLSREAIGPAVGVERSEPVDIGKPMQQGEKRILVAIAQSDGGADRSALALMTGYKRSTRDRYLQYLQARGYVAPNGNGRLLPTQGGMNALGSDFEPLPVGDELREHWLKRLPKGEADILRVVCTAYPDPVAKDDISEKVGLARSSRDRYIQYLSARQLVHAARAGAVIADEKLFG
jgi:uncharacterized protein